MEAVTLRAESLSAPKCLCDPTNMKRGVRTSSCTTGITKKQWAFDLSKILKAGDHYEIRSVQDLYGKVVAEGVFGGGFHIPFLHGNDVKVALEPIPPATPVGLTKSIAPTTAPEFAVFLVTVRDPNATTAGAATAGATKLGAVAK